MAHQIESIAYVGETPWHKLGTKLDNPPTVEEAIRAAGLDWTVGLKALNTYDGIDVPAQATYRMVNGEVQILGVVGPTYRPLQNKDALGFFDPFLQAGEASIETAGSLRSGQIVWALAKVNRDPVTIVPGDDVCKYILLSNSHDGTLAIRVGFTPVRVVCANTLSMAHGDAASKLLRVRHTKGAKLTLDAIRDVMNTANASFEATAEQYRKLAAKPINTADLETYVRAVLSQKKSVTESAIEATSAAAEEAVQKRDSKALATVLELFERGVGSDLPSVRGTYWGAYNAVTEYTTHLRGRDDETRLAAQFSDAGNLNRKALSLALSA